jgi:2-polyprenyl-3-methyl-5-hydroxy-6-metoxy-1,4-benzoquinol methylase
MKYYEMHDDAYKNLKSNGYISWDREKNVQALYEHDINVALKNSLSRYFTNVKSKKSLDLGTGTGTVALFLAREGFNSTGYDVSETAIKMALDNATALGMNVTFKAEDINELNVNEHFDLIVDSSFLHCIVPDVDRSNCYEFARKSLTKEGFFFIHTMIESDDMSGMLTMDHLVLKEEVLWSTGKDSWEMDWQEVDGQKVFPHRRILSQERLEQEIRENGFEILESSTKNNDKNPLTYTAWLKVKGE